MLDLCFSQVTWRLIYWDGQGKLETSWNVENPDSACHRIMYHFKPAARLWCQMLLWSASGFRKNWEIVLSLPVWQQTMDYLFLFHLTQLFMWWWILYWKENSEGISSNILLNVMILSAIISLCIFCLNTSDDRRLIIYKPNIMWVSVDGCDRLITTNTTNTAKTNRKHWTG